MIVNKIQLHRQSGITNPRQTLAYTATTMQPTCHTRHEYGPSTKVKGYAQKDTPDDSDTMFSSVVIARITEAIYNRAISTSDRLEIGYSDRMVQSTSAPTARRRQDINGIRNYCL